MTSIFFKLLSSFILFNDNVDANKFSSIFAIGICAAENSFFSWVTKILVKKFELSNLENGIGLKIIFFFHHYFLVKQFSIKSIL